MFLRSTWTFECFGFPVIFLLSQYFVDFLFWNILFLFSKQSAMKTAKVSVCCFCSICCPTVLSVCLKPCACGYLMCPVAILSEWPLPWNQVIFTDRRKCQIWCSFLQSSSVWMGSSSRLCRAGTLESNMHWLVYFSLSLKHSSAGCECWRFSRYCSSEINCLHWCRKLPEMNGLQRASAWGQSTQAMPFSVPQGCRHHTVPVIV